MNKWFYGESYLERVDCLCPYFWKTILAIIAIPLALLVIGIEKIPRVNMPSVSVDKKVQVAKTVATGLLALGGFALPFGIIAIGIWKFLLILGALGIVIGSCVGVGLLVFYIHDKYQEWQRGKAPKEPKPKRENIVIKYAKAKKDKHCPLVMWDD